jgi:hypothetical protein
VEDRSSHSEEVRNGRETSNHTDEHAREARPPGLGGAYMRHAFSSGKAAVVGGLLGLLLVIGWAGPAAAVNVATCADFSLSGATRFDITQNIVFGGLIGTCLQFPSNSTVYLNGHVITGVGLEHPTTGIFHPGNGFILGPGIVKAFGTCIDAGAHMAIEDLLTNQCSTGIRAGDSYKIKEVRVHDCVSSFGPDIGIDLFDSAGGFLVSSIVRACNHGVITGKNNKIWNLVVSRHNDVGLEVGGGTAVSRSVISSPRSESTIGLDYTGCCQDGAAGRDEGCQDGSNSVQDHFPGSDSQRPLNILVELPPPSSELCKIVTDTRTNCGGDRVPFDSTTGLITDDC